MIIVGILFWSSLTTNSLLDSVSQATHHDKQKISDKLLCYTFHLKNVLWLEKNVSHAMGQNSQIP